MYETIFSFEFCTVHDDSVFRNLRKFNHFCRFKNTICFWRNLLFYDLVIYSVILKHFILPRSFNMFVVIFCP